MSTSECHHQTKTSSWLPLLNRGSGQRACLLKSSGVHSHPTPTSLISVLVEGTGSGAKMLGSNLRL